MSKFAFGKHALGICDRCGQRCDYTAMKKEWTGIKVCSKCWEAKHPQLGPFRVGDDPQALFDPRTEPREIVHVTAGDQYSFPPLEPARPLQAIASVGEVGVTIT